MRLRLAVCLGLCITFIGSSMAFAQQNQPGLKSNTTVVRRQKAPPVKSRSAGNTEANTSLQKPPEMPGITFPNAKFIYGFSADGKGGRSMAARFEVPDQSSSVISYYKQSLANTGWKIYPSDKPDQLNAECAQYKSSVTITTFKSPKPGCEVLFGYAVKY